MGQRSASADGARFRVEDGDGNVWVFGHVSAKSPSLSWIEAESTVANPPANEKERLLEVAKVANALAEVGGFRFSR